MKHLLLKAILKFCTNKKLFKCLIINPLRDSGTYVYHDCDCNVTIACHKANRKLGFYSQNYD